MSRPLHIEVFFDFICPWCLIGKRQLDGALERLRAGRPDLAVTIQWHGVQLLPDLPARGVPFAEFYLRRLGSEQAVRLRQAQVREVAAANGVDIDFARIERMPNSANAHRLLQRTAQLGSAAQVEVLLERLFAAYFHNGEDIGDPATLLRIAEACGFGFSPLDLVDCLRGDGNPFIGDSAWAGATGVPYFVFDRHLELSGAQSTEVLLGAMQAALARRAAEEQPA